MCFVSHSRDQFPDPSPFFLSVFSEEQFFRVEICPGPAVEFARVPADILASFFGIGGPPSIPATSDPEAVVLMISTDRDRQHN